MVFFNGLKNGLFKSDSVEGFLKEVDFKKEDNDMVLECDFDSFVSFLSVDSLFDFVWSLWSVLFLRGVELSVFRELDIKKFVLYRYKIVFKKFGWLCLC